MWYSTGNEMCCLSLSAVFRENGNSSALLSLPYLYVCANYISLSFYLANRLDAGEVHGRYSAKFQSFTELLWLCFTYLFHQL